MAPEKGVPPAQLALARVLAQGEDMVSVPGTKRRQDVEQNPAAVDGKLTDEDPARTRPSYPARYDEAGMAWVNPQPPGRARGRVRPVASPPGRPGC